MGRNLRIEGITLHSRRFGEFHKSVTILSREGGIVDAVLHGGYKGKSRLAGATEPFRQVNFLLYHNPVKDTYKISDAEIINSFELFRTDLARIYAASYWCELMIRTRGAGAGFQEGESYRLLQESLEILENSDHRRLIFLNIQFLWRFLEISGLGIDIDNCTVCGKKLEMAAFYSIRERGLLCGACGLGRGFENKGEMRLSAGDLKYLRNTVYKRLKDILRVAPPGGGMEALEKIPGKFIKSEMEISIKTPDYHQFL